MNERHENRDFLAWIEKAEPYVAIRLFVAHLGIALVLAIVGGAGESIPPALDFLPFSLGGVARRDVAFDFGYPIRELVWGGDWWRIPVGALLPSGLGILLFSWLMLFPFVRSLERGLSRSSSALIYVAGGFVAVIVDFCQSPGVTSGGLGMLFSGAGASWTLNRYGASRVESETFRPNQRLFFLVLIALMCGLPFLVDFSLGATLSQRSLTTLTPSWLALFSAAVTGAALALPFARKRVPMDDLLPFPGVQRPDPPRLLGLTAVSAGWFVGLIGMCASLWWTESRPDAFLWRLEPALIAGDDEARSALEAFAEEHPEDRFVQKRLAVHYLRRSEFENGTRILDRLQESAPGLSATETLPIAQRNLRMADLNLRSAEEVAPWRYSGISANYETDALRLAMDLAQAARLQGDRERLSQARSEYFERFERFFAAEVKAASDQGKTVHQRDLEARRLNGVSYSRIEMEGDLARSIEEASRAVSLERNPMFLDTLAWGWIRSGSAEEGIDLLREALFSYEGPTSGTILFHLGVAHAETGDLKKAESQFREALRFDLEWWEEIEIAQKCPDCPVFSTNP